MRRILNAMIRRRQSTKKLADHLGEVYDPTSDTDRTGLALLVLLRPQLEGMGFQLGTLPADGPFASQACRGYLFGLTAAVLHAEGVQPTKDASLDAVIGAFGLVYGDSAGGRLVAQTLEDIQSNKAVVALATRWAEAEVANIYRTGSVRATGFVMAFSGEIFTADAPT